MVPGEEVSYTELEFETGGDASGVYRACVITAVLGAPGSGKSTVARPLATRLPGHVVLDWDALMDPAAALAGREISRNPDTWPAYRQLVRAVLDTMKHVPVVLLGVCTPTELAGWPIDGWAMLDSTDEERWRRLPAVGAGRCPGGNPGRIGVPGPRPSRDRHDRAATGQGRS
jgi:hypothetical protein